MQEAEKEAEQETDESFASWRSGSEKTRSLRQSGDSQRHSIGSTVTPVSGVTRPSSQWMDQRPSADTPLPSTSGGVPGGGGSVYKGSSLAVSEAPAGPATRRSRSSELMRPSSDSRLGGGGGDPGARPSSDGSASVYSAAGSGRSSFALERASLEANRASLEAFQEAFATGALMPASRLSQQLQARQPGEEAPAAAAGPDPAVALDQLMQAAQLPSSLREK